MCLKQCNLVDRGQVSISLDYECSKPNALYICLGLQVYLVVRYIIEMNHSADMRWNEVKSGKGQSIITVLQLYDDKSKTQVNVGDLKFYQFHINFMNFSESMPELIYSHGHTILAYIPVKFFYMQNGQLKVDSSLGRIAKLRNVHHITADVMKPLAEIAVCGSVSYERKETVHITPINWLVQYIHYETKRYSLRKVL